MLFAPMVSAWLAAGRWPGSWAALLVLTVTAAFLGRNAAGLALRKRGGSWEGFWAAAFGATAVLSLVALVVVGGFRGLAPVGLAAAALFAAHSRLSVRAGGRRLDRSTGGEILGVAALTLTGPAAYVVAGGEPGVTALVLWVGAFLFYTGGVLSVRSRIDAIRTRGAFGPAERRSATRHSVAYHVLLAAVALGGASAAGGAWAWLVFAAFLPAFVRAFRLAATLSNTPPNLKVVGMVETGLAVWFSGVFAAAIRLGPFAAGR
jgi:hypothetical protein